MNKAAVLEDAQKVSDKVASMSAAKTMPNGLNNIIHTRVCAPHSHNLVSSHRVLGAADWRQPDCGVGEIKEWDGPCGRAKAKSVYGTVPKSRPQRRGSLR